MVYVVRPDGHCAIVVLQHLLCVGSLAIGVLHFGQPLIILCPKHLLLLLLLLFVLPLLRVVAVAVVLVPVLLLLLLQVLPVVLISLIVLKEFDIQYNYHKYYILLYYEALHCII